MRWIRDASEKTPNVRTDLVCPECGSKITFVEKGRYGSYYACERYPDCRVTHKAKPDGSPAGVIGDLETIALRKAAHKKFDQLWMFKENPKEARTKCYEWLARKLSVPLEQCHISMFNKETLRQVIGLSEWALKQFERIRQQQRTQPELFNR